MGEKGEWCWALVAFEKGHDGRPHGEEMQGASGSSHVEEGEGGGGRPTTRGWHPTGSDPAMAAPFGAEQGREREADRWGQVAQCCFKLIPFNLNRFKQTLNCSNFNQSKKNLPKLKKFEIKYGV
jgi:hypothetical protein